MSEVSEVTRSRRIIRLVMWNSAFWYAGNLLISGGFVSYFGYDLGLNAFGVSLLLATPETVGIVGLGTRSLVFRWGNRKWVWATFSLLARLVTLGIPLLAWLKYAGIAPAHSGYWLIGLLATGQACQAISTVAYSSWVTDLVPVTRFGPLLAWRNVANLLVAMVIPVMGGMLRDQWKLYEKQGLWPVGASLWAYVAIFLIGVFLQLLSMLFFWNLPHPNWNRPKVETSDSSKISTAADPHLFYLLGFSLWHAFWSGLTQSVFFLYRLKVLHIELMTYYLLESAMKLVQMPYGLVSSRYGKTLGRTRWLVVSWLLVTLSMLGWLLATPKQWWWIWGVYLLWGAWAGINVTGTELCWRLAPKGDNTFSLAVFDRVAGMLAGISGLIGGWYLDSWLQANRNWTMIGYSLSPYHLLIMIGLLGRLSAGLWLLGLRDRKDDS